MDGSWMRICFLFFFLFIWIVGIYFLRSTMKVFRPCLFGCKKQKNLAAMRMETALSISAPRCIYSIRYTYVRIYVYTASKLSKTQRTIIQIRLEKSGWAHHMDRARGRHVWLSTHRHGTNNGPPAPLLGIPRQAPTRRAAPLADIMASNATCETGARLFVLPSSLFFGFLFVYACILVLAGTRNTAAPALLQSPRQ